MRLSHALASAMAISLAACSPRVEGDLEPGAIHVRPVSTSTGMPSAARAVVEVPAVEVALSRASDRLVLDGVSVEKVDETAPSARNRDLAGLIVRPAAPGVRGALVVTDLGWNADAVDVLHVRAFFPDPGHLRVYFKRKKDEDFAPANFFETQVGATFRARDWSFDVARHSGWTGTITALRLEVQSENGTWVADRLTGAGRCVTVGASPTLEEDTPLDIGLVALTWASDDGAHVEREARRAYPSFAGEPQVAHLPAVRDVGVAFSFALPPRVSPDDGDVMFEIAVAPRGASDPEEARTVFRQCLVPAIDADRWHTGWVPLLPDEPTERDLYFRTTSVGERDRVEGLWGSMVFTVPRERRPPSIVLVTADTLRADHLGFLGAKGGVTPRLDELAARGSVFVDTLSTCNATSPSHASILTGLFPKDHRVETNVHVLSENLSTIAEKLRAAGWFTVASTSARHLNSRYSGFGQGFDVFLETPEVEGCAPYRSARACNPQIARVLREVGDQPFFIWVHYFDAHTPYAPDHEFAERFLPGDARREGAPLAERLALLRAKTDRGFRARALAEFGSSDDPKALARALVELDPSIEFARRAVDDRVPRALYRAGVCQLDQNIGDLIDAIDSLGRTDDTIFVFTADHGESLGERDIWFSHEGLYRNTLAVPLVFAGPGVPAGVRSSEPAQTTDIFPTLCELLDLEPPAEGRGLSLVGAMRGQSLGARRRWFQHSENTEAGFREGNLHAVVSLADHPRGILGRLVPTDATELYDLRADPTLLHDLAPEDSAAGRAQRAADETKRWLEDVLFDADAVRTSANTSHLGDLGYSGD